MNIQFRDETFRDNFTFRNSEWAIKRFPFPFHEDSYMYSVNMEPHKGGPGGSVYENRFDVDEHYVSEMKDRALVLAEDPSSGLRAIIAGSGAVGPKPASPTFPWSGCSNKLAPMIWSRSCC